MVGESGGTQRVTLGPRYDPRMSPLFRKSADTAAAQAAGEAELNRLTTLSTVDLAAEIMPAFGPDGPGGAHGINAVQVAQWLMASYERSPGLKPLLLPIQNATQALQQSGLVEEKVSGIGTGSSSAKATALGQQALAEGTVHQLLEPAGSSARRPRRRQDDT
jgi:hypothetical protein